MPKPEKPKPIESGDPLRDMERDTVDEAEEVLVGYYPNLRPGVKPRDWDEPPWGHR